MGESEAGRAVLVHLASGIGNIVLATPLLAALDEMGFVITLALDADYPETAELFRDWSLIRGIVRGEQVPQVLRDHDLALPAIPPFYWRKFAPLYPAGSRIVARPPDSLFYRDEKEYYLAFARRLGYPGDRRPDCRLPIAPGSFEGITMGTLVLAPGCKTGIMAAKRWPRFGELADLWDDVAVVGTADDLSGMPPLPSHVKSYVGRLGLRQTAELMASAGAVTANDSGIGHLAAAMGVPTVLLFGPTPHLSLGTFPAHVRVLRAGLPCEPCWNGQRLRACDSRVDCLPVIEAAQVIHELEHLIYRSFPA